MYQMPCAITMTQPLTPWCFAGQARYPKCEGVQWPYTCRAARQGWWVVIKLSGIGFCFLQHVFLVNEGQLILQVVYLV
ncbi:hypothetical protein HaLaN_08909, partial [Haematococcus lacustris]